MIIEKIHRDFDVPHAKNGLIPHEPNIKISRTGCELWSHKSLGNTIAFLKLLRLGHTNKISAGRKTWHETDRRLLVASQRNLFFGRVRSVATTDDDR